MRQDTATHLLLNQANNPYNSRRRYSILSGAFAPRVRPLRSRFLSGAAAMIQTERRLLDALAKIAEVAGAVVNGGEDSLDESSTSDSEETPHKERLVCTPRPLPGRLLLKAAETATKINPVNAPAR